ncbi:MULTISPECIES: ATP-binding cassette domain-containing protein [unclassified Marinobacterium]|uniref:ATP-binding cassette domain-containing protein n=1 Tax=unclassified Marinobacterium TaxID=2644139 RepID=UPI001567F146|nr:Macrolide export ATP-binding/permease protein MacB [Marinobacterium sp. xm-g-48]NRP14804.1 Macrolide export ATP-binding/permease protein MacB [Marinobacterium sp. xm-a-152]NRP58057.1 Macrolide export ATP-binding/permease protein MacB [Marinobacterium sp. xm-d-510]NRP83691.1 Macrolide export ATP-binding/permease protein MacB [Marinobacterium sp. xm-d-509]NRP98288.1 Macrolide export ATP-binding/permease protein MacB [Marinobacterium sp. xm-a-127]
MDKPVVAVKDLNFWFGSGEASKQALFDINLELPRGSLTVLMGPSGSGKTTLLTLIGCLRSIHEGSINLLDQELNGASHEKLTSIRQRLGFIFQAHNLHESLTAVQNVVMGVQVRSGVSDELAYKAAEQALHLVGLSSRLHYLPANLSGGQKQRVAVARALVGNPTLVLADEPTAALDKDSASDVVDLLKRLGAARGTTTLLVTHDDRILDRADRILKLEDGKIVDIV